MLFNPHTPIMIRGTDKPMTEETGAVVTHGLLAMRALDARHKEDEGKGEAPMKRFMLATRILAVEDGQTIDLTIDEAKMIKDALAALFPVGLYGQVHVAIDEAAKAPKANGKAEGAAAH
jgi:hypothetical protein